MTYNLKPTTQFKKDVKLCKKRGYDLSLLIEVLKMLETRQTLPERYRDHALAGSAFLLFWGESNSICRASFSF